MLLDILGFVFQGFWHFLGALILTTAILSGIAEIIKSIAMIIHGVPAPKEKEVPTADTGDEDRRDF